MSLWLGAGCQEGVLGEYDLVVWVLSESEDSALRPHFDNHRDRLK